MAVFRRSVAFTCAVLALLPLTACSKDSKSPTASSTASSPSTSSSSLGPLPSSSSSPSSSSGPCEAAAPPASAVNVTHADGDFNGDGASDSVTVYGTGTVTQPSPYHAQIELANSLGSIDTVIADAATDNNQAVKALGGAEITASAGLPPDGSGAELFVEVGSGASDGLVGVFQLIGCTLTRLTGPQGALPSSFAVGGSITHLDGLRCDGTAGGVRLVKLSATSNDGITYDTIETRLQVQNGAFSALGDPIVSSLSGNDPQLQAFSSLNCQGVQSL